MGKTVPLADEKSASMGWIFDPGFIQNVQRVAADVENPSMESIDSVLFALRKMGYIKVAGTCEHGFTVQKLTSPDLARLACQYAMHSHAVEEK